MPNNYSDLVLTDAAHRLEATLTNAHDKRRRAFFVEKPKKGRRFVIADIHGCYQTFSSLLKKIRLQKRDQLFIVGDMIDRGPYSLLVVEKIANLIMQGYSVFPLRGNHEQLALDFNRENPKKLFTFSERQYASHLLNSSGHLIKSVEKFFDQLPYYYETDAAYMVHAGFNTTKKKPFEAWKDMIWIRDFKYRKKIFNKKLAIHGHVPTPYQKIKANLDADVKAVNLDNGCVKGNIGGFGKLLCLNLDTGELISQKNKDIMLS